MVFGLILMVVSSAGRKTRIPFAPSLAVGAVIAVFWGAPSPTSLFHAGVLNRCGRPRRRRPAGDGRTPE